MGMQMNGRTLIVAGSILSSAKAQPRQASPQMCIYSLSRFTQLLHSLFHLVYNIRLQ